ncbi:MAG: 4'-phosphopantetheinyl transferase superfamily protein [Lachnospiraceae bacterium]|nr:4'-phosphopantetheinyl transferase superfamily protein [Lachnospiraceae bacterium]
MELFETKVYVASTAELEDEQVFHALYQTVSKERREKIDKLRFPKDKRLSLAAEVLLKKALIINGIGEFECGIGENGKPFLVGNSSVEFNLSHSEERVMCVISNQEAGCDVERIRDTDYKVARHFFTTEENDMIEAAGLKKQEMFFRIWTLKESFLKATGLGMRIPLKDFYFSIDEDRICVYQNVNQASYYFKEYDLHDGYRYAVCSLNPAFADIVKVDLI